MAIDFLALDRLPALRLYALNEDGTTLADLSDHLVSSKLSFTDELISHQGTFVLANSSTGSSIAYYDKYGSGGGANVLVENRLIQFWKGFLDPANSYAPVWYAAFTGRIASGIPIYSRGQAQIITITAFDLLKLSLKRKFTSDVYYNTQLNLIGSDLFTRYGDKALQLFGTNFAALNYSQIIAQFPDMNLIDCQQDLFDIPIFQVWVNYGGQPETFPKLGSSGNSVLGYPDSISPPTADFDFGDSHTVTEISPEWQDHSFINQVRVQGVALAQRTTLGPSQLLASSPDNPVAGVNFNFVSAGAGPRYRLFFTEQSGRQNSLTASNVYLKIWDPNFAFRNPNGTSNNPLGSPYKYIASVPGIINDIGQIIPFPHTENNFPAGTQGVASYKSDGRLEGGISILNVAAFTPFPTPADPAPLWPPNYIDLGLYANSDGGGFEWFVQIYGQPVIADDLVLTAIADYNAQITTETLSDAFGDHQTYQGGKQPWAMGTPIEVSVNPAAMPSTALTAGSLAGVDTITIGSSAGFAPPTIPSIYANPATQTPAANAVVIGSGSTREYGIIKSYTSTSLTFTGTLQYAHSIGEVVAGLTGVISYDDVLQSLLVKGDWDRGRVVFNDQTFRPFSADAYNTGGTAHTFSTPVIDTSRLFSPAPQSVYQSYRQGVAAGAINAGFSYNFSGLQIGRGYKLRLHFADDISTKAGQRIFAIYVNGAVQEQSFDIVSLTGAQYSPYIYTLDGVNCQPDGTLAISLQNGGTDGGKASPICSGLELILPQGTGGTAFAINCGGPAIGPSPSTTLTATASAGANTLHVTSASGMVVGRQLQVGDNSPSGVAENVTISGISGLIITITGTLGYTHANGSNVYVLPVIQARYGWSAVQQTYGVQSKTIDDPLLQTLVQAQNRARYEVNKEAWARNPVKVVAASVPTIKPGKSIKWFNPRISTFGSDMWGYVQAIDRMSERGIDSAIDEDTYSCFLLNVQARSS